MIKRCGQVRVSVGGFVGEHERGAQKADERRDHRETQF